MSTQGPLTQGSSTQIANAIQAQSQSAGFTQTLFNALLGASTPYATSAAEIAASVTPTNFAIPPYPIDPRRYGADNTGASYSDTAWSNAIAVARKSTGAGRVIYVNGIHKVHSLNFASNGAVDFNTGFTIYGDGNDSSIINIETASANSGIGVDCGAMVYFVFRDLQFNFGTSAANCPQVGLLLARGNLSGSVVFSGIGTFQRCIFNAWGTYGIYDYCSEQIDFNDCVILGLTTTTIPVVLSRVNTAGITSPNFTIDTNNVSMTCISFSGAESTISSKGSGATYPNVLLDIGTSTGIAGVNFGVTYMPATGATSICIADNGGSGSILQNITSDNLVSEQNAGSGTQQVAVFSAASTRHMNLRGYSAFGSGVTQTSELITFGNPVFSSHVNWNGNVTQTLPVNIISAPSGAAGCIFQVDGNHTSVSMAAGAQSLIMAADGIFGSMGTIGFSGGIGLFGNSAPAQSTGWGSPTGGSVANNFSGSAATLPQTSAALAEVIVVLKQFGLLAA